MPRKPTAITRAEPRALEQPAPAPVTHWTTADAAAAWGCSTSAVRLEHARGRIPGSEVVRGKLLIPAGTPKPAVDLSAPDGGGRKPRT